MLNKNVADYTNFDGKTNKRIVQAPGGSSSISFGWGGEQTQPRNTPQRPHGLSEHHHHSYQPQPEQEPPPFNINQPIRVMGEQPSYQIAPVEHKKSPPVGTSHPQQYQPTGKIGGEYGYSGYSGEEAQYSKPMPANNFYQQDSLDLKVEEQNRNRQTPSSHTRPEPASKASIRTYQQKNVISLGDNSYNYWKDTGDSSQSRRQQPPSSQTTVFGGSLPQDRPGIRVHNPPGGKTNFSLG